ncbi:MAG: hypothetical protein COA78_06650 [Blastopirellula sp.]|nr:MAG: hypothetical protein COA78_06650 [Blastopirellula sp.]
MSSEWDNDDQDEEWTDEDYSDDDSDYVDQCPECGVEIYADADVCPQCGHFIIHENSVWKGRSTWWIVLGLLGMLAVIFALSF